MILFVITCNSFCHALLKCISSLCFLNESETIYLIFLQRFQYLLNDQDFNFWLKTDEKIRGHHLRFIEDQSNVVDGDAWP